MPAPSYTPAVAKAMSGVYERLRPVIPPLEWPVHAPWIHAIQEWKQRRRAIVLAHNYQTPEIFHGIADVTGDSLFLARQAAEVDADVIVMCGVRFMAETVSLLNPGRVVLLPDLSAGCSLASSIDADQVKALRAQHPGVPVVSYVNTSAPVKAESDICCTSGNAVQVVRSLGQSRVIFLPDEYLGRHVAAQLPDIDLILHDGHCEVHERFRPEDVTAARSSYPGVHVLAHPECPPDVLAMADYVGSTAEMSAHVARTRPHRVLLFTECSMSDNLAVEHPDLEFVRPCALCPHMKTITLPKVLAALQNLEPRIQIPATIAIRASQAVTRMLALPAA